MRKTQAALMAKRKTLNPRRVSSLTQVTKRAVTSRVKHHSLKRVSTGTSSKRKLKRMIASLAFRAEQAECRPLKRVHRHPEEDDLIDLNLCNYQL